MTSNIYFHRFFRGRVINVTLAIPRQPKFQLDSVLAANDFDFAIWKKDPSTIGFFDEFEPFWGIDAERIAEWPHDLNSAFVFGASRAFAFIIIIGDGVETLGYELRENETGISVERCPAGYWGYVSAEEAQLEKKIANALVNAGARRMQRTWKHWRRITINSFCVSRSA